MIEYGNRDELTSSCRELSSRIFAIHRPRFLLPTSDSVVRWSEPKMINESQCDLILLDSSLKIFGYHHMVTAITIKQWLLQWS